MTGATWQRAAGEVVDVLVVGGGPVGLFAAIEARLRGLSVLLVDPRLPDGSGTGIDKACGEGLMPVAVEALAQVGVSLRGGSFRGIRYVDGVTGRQARAALPSPGMGVERTVLSAALLQRAEQVGVELRHARCVELRPGTSATAALRDSRSATTMSVTAHWVMAADGLHSPARRMLGVPLRPAPTRRWGVHEHLSLAPWSSDVEVYWGRTTETYVTPLAEDRVGVAVLGRRGLSLDVALQESPVLARHLAEAHLEQRPRPLGAGPLWQRPSRRVVGNVLLVGDAAGYVDGLTGDGLGVGFLTAKAALDAVAAGDPGSYERRWRVASRRYRALTSAVVLAAATPPVRRRLVPTARALPGVFQAAVTVLAGGATSPAEHRDASGHTPCSTSEEPRRPLHTSS